MVSERLAVVILTYNEGGQSAARACIRRWLEPRDLRIDSFGTDRTREIARDSRLRRRGKGIRELFEQRNYALTQLPITSEWVLFLDADEWLPDAVKAEISQVLGNVPTVNGFFLGESASDVDGPLDSPWGLSDVDPSLVPLGSALMRRSSGQ